MHADELVAAVRVHGDRVHDAVRRVGCAPQAAVDVVHASATELVDAVATEPEVVQDAVGWWFARAWSLGHSEATRSDVPVGAGLLAGDDEQGAVAHALDALPDQDRLALLLRDSYDLPEQSVATALGTSADEAMARIARARLALLPLLGLAAPAVPAHVEDLGALARLGEPRPVAARDARARRHAEGCLECSDVLEAQSRVSRRLAGLSVVALPPAARAAVLADVDARAHDLLPGGAPPLPGTWSEDGERPRREPRLSPLVALASLLLAALVGAATGRALAEQDEPVRRVGGEVTLPPGVSFASPPPSADASPPSPPTVPPQRPRTSVFVVPPPPLPTPTPTPTPTPSPTPSRTPPALALSPQSGPNGTAVTVSGVGFDPGQQVRVAYLGVDGEPTGSQALAAADAEGRFSTGLAAQDPAGEPGPHEIVATSGDTTARAVFTAEEEQP